MISSSSPEKIVLYKSTSWVLLPDVYETFLNDPVFLTPPAALNASIKEELLPTKTFPGLLTWPYTKTENSWIEAIFNLTFIFL